MTALTAEGLRLGYGSTTVVHDLDLVVPEGKVTAIVGPNGCGKSTLLRGLSRLLRPLDGQVLLDGQDLHRMPTKQVARSLALLPQQPVAPDGSRSASWSPAAATPTTGCCGSGPARTTTWSPRPWS